MMELMMIEVISMMEIKSSWPGSNYISEKNFRPHGDPDKKYFIKKIFTPTKFFTPKTFFTPK